MPRANNFIEEIASALQKTINCAEKNVKGPNTQHIKYLLLSQQKTKEGFLNFCHHASFQTPFDGTQGSI